MKLRITVMVLSFALASYTFAAPGGSTAFVLVNESPLYQDNPDKSLNWTEALTIGDTVSLTGRTAAFKESGKDRDFTRVKAPDGKEGWIRSQFLAGGDGHLAVVKSEKATIYSEPRDVKLTSRFISNMTIVGVAPGPNQSFSLVKGYDIPQGVLLAESTFVSSADLTAADADVQAAILFTVAAASKSAAVRTNLLKLSASKYPNSVFIDKIQAALGADAAPSVATSQAAPAASTAHVPVQLNNDLEGPNAVKSFDGEIGAQMPPTPMKIKTVTATSSLTEKTMTHIPKQIADGDTKTAWVEGAKGNGVGEKVTLFPEGSGAATGIWVLPGFAASETMWNSNNRAAVLTLRFLQVSENGDYRVIDSHGTDRFVLKMQMVGGMVPFNQWQYFDLGQGLWGEGTVGNAINAVMLEITSIDGKNSKYQDTCISEVALSQETLQKAGVSAGGQAQTASSAPVQGFGDVQAQWARSVMAADDQSFFSSVATDSAGNVYAAGEIRGKDTIFFGNNVSAAGTDKDGNALLVKYNSSGVAQWARSMTAGSAFSSYSSVATDGSGNVYAAGTIYGAGVFSFGNDVSVLGSDKDGNALLVKYNGAGDAQWARSVRASSAYSRYASVAVDGAGNVYAAGSINGTGVFSFGDKVSARGTAADISVEANSVPGMNAILVKYSTSGTALWARTVTAGSGQSSLYAVAADGMGNIYATGEASAVSFGHNADVPGTSSGTVLVKYNGAGDSQWAKSVTAGAGGRGGPDFSSVAIDKSGNIYVAGSVAGKGKFAFGDNVTVSGTSMDATVLLVKYSATGVAQWARSMTGDSYHAGFYSIATDSAGNTYAAGGLQEGKGALSFGNGVSVKGWHLRSAVVLVKYNAMGVAQWAKSGMEGSAEPQFNSVTTDVSGNVYAAGRIKTGSFSFGENVSVSGTHRDGNVLLVRYSPVGEQELIAGGNPSGQVRITVATDATWPPMEMVDPDKNIVGFDIDIMNAAAKAGGFTVEYRFTTWDAIFAGLQNGAYDAVMSAVTINDERKATMDFTVPYFDAGPVIVVRTGTSGVTRLVDLKSRTVAALTGTTGASALDKVKNMYGITATTYDNLDQAVAGLLDGSVDALVLGLDYAANCVLQNDQYKGRLKIVGERIVEEYYGVAVKKGNKKILDLINVGLKKVLDSGDNKAIEARWLAQTK
jgi:ABC-type amino acid transport substrate-binding protein